MLDDSTHPSSHPRARRIWLFGLFGYAASMNPPVCKICRTAHWALEPHRFSSRDDDTLERLFGPVSRTRAISPAEKAEQAEALRTAAEPIAASAPVLTSPNKGPIVSNVSKSTEALRPLVARMSDGEFRRNYNVYQAEYQKRWRRRKVEKAAE